MSLITREKEVKKVSTQKNITLENIYKMVVDLQRDMDLIKKSFIEEPELRDDFILRMRDIDLEKSIQSRRLYQKIWIEIMYKLEVKETLDRKFNKT